MKTLAAAPPPVSRKVLKPSRRYQYAHMAEFICTRCGKCCMRMGDHVTVVARMGPHRYACTHGLGNHSFFATVEQPFHDRAPNAESMERGWCPFLVEGDDGRYHCAIHASRPPVCQIFQCCRMRIYDRDGQEAGAVKGRRSLSTPRSDLQEIWDAEVEPITTGDDREWAEQVGSVLARHGFSVEVYE